VGNGHNLLTDRVYVTLKNAIQSWQLLPGDSLIESRLASELQVSKTPVRESLARLAQDGLAQAAPYRSYKVADLSAADAQSIMELRAVLEGLAARRACERFAAEDRAQVVALTQAAATAAEEERWRDTSDLVHQVHQMVVDGCGDMRLQNFIGVLNGQYERARRVLPLDAQRLRRSMAEHNDLAAAIATGQSVMAEQVMRMHLMSMVDSVRQGVADLLVEAVRHDTAEPPPLSLNPDPPA